MPFRSTRDSLCPSVLTESRPFPPLTTRRRHESTRTRTNRLSLLCDSGDDAEPMGRFGGAVRRVQQQHAAYVQQRRSQQQFLSGL
ncbi:hypothetical protein L596_024650 [Steinernema carpocapsae]|uniref:Uncharacterized protein n=1 Tax=Steinernema carpocapsae TaxID=34508 RepID=A0A4U5M5E4_STECR|nr:hypothetical protein L596_024650 [Steinernema carpocapsae]